MKTSTPEDVGLSSTRLNRIHKVMQGYVDQNQLAGLITMLARRGQIVHFERFSTLYGPAVDGGLEVIEGPASYENSRPQYPVSGSTGLVSTAPDYMRFAQMLLNGGELDGARLLGRKTVELMTVNHLPADLVPIAATPDDIMNGYGYGLGFSVLMHVPQSEVLSSEGSFGWAGYATTHFWVDPRQELIGLIMAQFVPIGYYPVYDQFRVLCYQAIFD